LPERSLAVLALGPVALGSGKPDGCPMLAHLHEHCQG